MAAKQRALSEAEKSFLKNIGFRVQFFRKKAGLSQAELAEKSDLGESTISHLESNSVYSVSLVLIFRIAAALDIQPKALFEFD